MPGLLYGLDTCAMLIELIESHKQAALNNTSAYLRQIGAGLLATDAAVLAAAAYSLDQSLALPGRLSPEERKILMKKNGLDLYKECCSGCGSNSN